MPLSSHYKTIIQTLSQKELDTGKVSKRDHQEIEYSLISFGQNPHQHWYVVVPPNSPLAGIIGHIKYTDVLEEYDFITQANCDYVIKRPRGRGVSVSIERWRHEAAIIAHLTGRPIAEIYHERPSYNDKFFIKPEILMERVKGPRFVDIPEYFSEQIDLSRALKLIIDLFESLSLIHQKNVIHGDIHPGNVMFDTKKERVMFIDFGFSEFKADCNENEWPQKLIKDYFGCCELVMDDFFNKLLPHFEVAHREIVDHVIKEMLINLREGGLSLENIINAFEQLRHYVQHNDLAILICPALEEFIPLLLLVYDDQPLKETGIDQMVSGCK